MCVTVLPTCKSIPYLCAWCPLKPTKVIGSLRTEVIFHCEHQMSAGN